MIYYKFLRLEPIYYFCEIDYVFKTEIFKSVKGFEDKYQISDLGRLKSLKRDKMHISKYLIVSNERILKPGKNCHGYLGACLYDNKKCFSKRMHLLVSIAFLNHTPDGTHKIIVDHINNIKLDNRAINLQLTSSRVNNSKDVKNKTSKYTGVSWDKNNKKWLSQIVFNKKTYNLGRYKCEIEAKKAYDDRLKIGK